MSLLSPSGDTPQNSSTRGSEERKPVRTPVPKSKNHKAATLPCRPAPVAQAGSPLSKLEKPEVEIPFTVRCEREPCSSSVFLELGGILQGLNVEFKGHTPPGSHVHGYLQSAHGERFEFSGTRATVITLPILHTLAMRVLRQISPMTSDTQAVSSALCVPITELEALFKETVTDSRVKVIGKTTPLLISLADGIYCQLDRSVAISEVNQRSLALRRRADARLLFVASEASEQNRLLEEAITLLESAHAINSREPSIRMKLASVLIESVSKISKEPGNTLRNKKTARPYLWRLFVATRLLGGFKVAHAANSLSPDFFTQLKEVLDLLRTHIRENHHHYHPLFHAYSALVEIWFPKNQHAMQLPGKLILSTLLKEHRIRGIFQSLLSIFEHDEGYTGELATQDMAIRLPRLHGVKVLGVNIPLNGEWGVVQECSIHSTDVDLALYARAENELGLEEGVYWVEVKKRQSCRTIKDFYHALESNDRKLSTQLIAQELWCDILSERHGCPIKRLMIWCGPDCPDTPIKFKSYPEMNAFPPIAFCRTSSVRSNNGDEDIPFPSLEALEWTIGPGGINRTMANILKALQSPARDK